MSEALRVTTIQLDGKQVHLKFEVSNAGTWIGSELKSDDPPGADFEHTFKAFLPELLKLIGCPKAWGADVEMRTIAIDYLDEDQRRVKLHALKTLEYTNSPWNWNLPYLDEPDADGNGKLPTRMVRLLDELEQHAKLFIEGRRAQVDMFIERPRKHENGQLTLEQAEHQKKLELGAIIQERRMRAALLELKPSVTTDRVVSDAELIEAIARRWDSIEYVDNDAQTTKERRWPHVHKHYYNDQDGTGVMWCGALAKDIEHPGGERETLLRFWVGIMPDLFDENITPTLVKQEILPLYRELLELPALPVEEPAKAEEEPVAV